MRYRLAVILGTGAAATIVGATGLVLAHVGDQWSSETSRVVHAVPTVEYTKAVVTRVLDGETISVEGGLTVRYLGIDAPVIERADRSAECQGPDASVRNRELVEGRQIRLEADVWDTDADGRLLRYVFVDDQMVNEILVREGHARVATYLSGAKYEDRLIAAQQYARKNGLGLWGECSGTEDCDPSYPTVCIPSPPPDLDCGYVPHRNFPVLPPDPHGFDRDGDGIGCEP